MRSVECNKTVCKLVKIKNASNDLGQVGGGQAGLDPQVMSYVLPLPGNSRILSQKRKASPKKRVQGGAGKRRKLSKQKSGKSKKPKGKGRKSQTGGQIKRRKSKKKSSVAKKHLRQKGKGKYCSRQRPLKRR